MINTNFPFDAVDLLIFTRRPKPLPASLRPLYRIALITLVLKMNCRRNTASLLKLQFFNWLLKSESVREKVEKKISGHAVFNLDLIHLDPMVNLALKYAFADNLITVTNNSKYMLTSKGDGFTKRILKDRESVLREEVEILMRIGEKVSEVKLKGELI